MELMCVNGLQGKAKQQHGDGAVCADAKCRRCFHEEEWAAVGCPACDKHTGKVRTGLLCEEIFQVPHFSLLHAKADELI